MNIKFLPTITTTPRSDWRAKIQEIDELGLEEVALFPTMLDDIQRKELYSLLRKTKLKTIPFVHLRTGMHDDEMEMLMNDFGTKIFNAHSRPEHPVTCNLDKYGNKIYIENHFDKIDLEFVKKCAGICLDVSHHENTRLLIPEIYEYFNEIFKKNKIGCGHISAIKKTLLYDRKEGIEHYDDHYFDDFSEFDYIVNHKDILPSIMALEVGNPLSEQVRVIDYINSLL